MDDLDRLLEAFPSRVGTHYTDCHLHHPRCAVAYLVRRVRVAEFDAEQLRAALDAIWRDCDHVNEHPEGFCADCGCPLDREEADGE